MRYFGGRGAISSLVPEILVPEGSLPPKGPETARTDATSKVGWAFGVWQYVAAA